MLMPQPGEPKYPRPGRLFPSWMHAAVIWYPDRECLQSINPNGIGPYDWGFLGPEDLVQIPINYHTPAAYFICQYERL